MPTPESKSPFGSEIRTVVLLPQDGVILSPTPFRPQLFRDLADPTNRISNEGRAHMVGQRTGYDLPMMSVMHHLGHSSDVICFSVRPSSDTGPINLEAAKVTAFDLKETLELAEDNPNYVNPVDLVFIKRAFMRIAPRG